METGTNSANNTTQMLWWQTGIIYQIYPRSFQDSDDNGIGDLRGIIQRLDYLSWLGINIVWLSPIYPSPMADFGYDISDYKDIHPIFGTMADFDELTNEIHKRGMKVVLDLVPNHTSDKHPWFTESRSSRDNPKRDWYMWYDALEDGSPPNNWLSVFGGSAWEWDDYTKQYYYHAFLKEQPDLNWRNPEVQNAMLDVMRFWLEKGVDGFRVDVMWHMVKDKLLRNNPPNPEYQQWMATYEQLLPVFSTDQPEVHEIVHKMRKLTNEYQERMMIGEIYLPIHKLVAYYGTDNDGTHLPFNFMLIGTPWNAVKLSFAINEYESLLPKDGWPNWVLGNHDQPRISSRVGLAQTRIAAMLLLTLRGTPTMYYGDEIGMQDVPIPFEEVQDPQGLNMPEKNLSRDPARTPMQWDDSMNGGFSKTPPWLRLSRHYKILNVAGEKKKSHSILMLYKMLIKLRQSEPSLMYGDFIPIHSDHQSIGYIRHQQGHDRFFILLNLTHRPAYFNIKHMNLKGTIEIATHSSLEGNEFYNRIELYGDEGIIVRLKDE